MKPIIVQVFLSLFIFTRIVAFSETEDFLGDAVRPHLSEKEIKFYNTVLHIACESAKKSDYKPDKVKSELLSQLALLKDINYAGFKETHPDVFSGPWERDFVIENSKFVIGFGKEKDNLNIEIIFKPNILSKYDQINNQIYLDKECKNKAFDKQVRLLALRNGIITRQLLYDFNSKKIISVQNISPAALPLNVIYAGRSIPKLQEKRVKVGILDNGIDYNHPEIAFRVPREIKESKECDEFSTKLRELLQKKMTLDPKGKEASDIAREIAALKNYFSDLCETKVSGKNAFSQGLPFDTSSGEFNKEIQSHGTHVAGIACKDTGFIEITPIKIFPDCGFRNAKETDPQEVQKCKNERERKLSEGLEFLVRNGVKIVNMSFGANELGSYEVLKDFIKGHPEILFVIAAGNTPFKDRRNLDGSLFEVLPSRPNTIIVAAVNEKNELADFSKYGKTCVDLAASGVGINSCWPDCEYKICSGTSMATPQVSRTAARILHAHPNISAEQIKKLICSTVTPIKELSDKTITGGVLNEEAAVKSAKALEPPSPSKKELPESH